MNSSGLWPLFLAESRAWRLDILCLVFFFELFLPFQLKAPPGFEAVNANIPNGNVANTKTGLIVYTSW